MTFERSLETTAPPEKVWEIWSDISTWPQWNPDVRSIKLNGPFESGTTGAMTTGEGTQVFQLDEVRPGQSFNLVTEPMAATTFTFECQVEPVNGGSRVSQRVIMSGLLSPLTTHTRGDRIAASFEPVLAGLVKAAEAAVGSPSS